MNYDYLTTGAEQADRAVMLMLNYDGGVFQDWMWWSFSSRLIWIPVALAFLYVLMTQRKGWWRVLLIIAAVVLIIQISDSFATQVCKPFFARLRPSHDPLLAGKLHFVNDYHSGRYGFVSSHAANAVGVLTYIWLLCRRRAVFLPLLALTLCVCYSRIYLGVHFLGDVLCGSILGGMVGCAMYFATVMLHRRLIARGCTVSICQSFQDARMSLLSYSAYFSIAAAVLVGIGMYVASLF